MYQNSHQCTHCLKYYSETLWIFAIIEDFNSGLVVRKQVIVLSVHLIAAKGPENGQITVLTESNYLQAN